jgi:hypothetical protein
MFFVVHNPLSEINRIKLGETREQRRQAGASPAGEQQNGRSAPDSPKPPVGGLYVPEQRQPHLHPRGGGFPIAAFITSSNGVVSPVRVATPPPQSQQAQPRSPHRATTPRASLDASRHASFDRNFYAHRGVGGAGPISSSSSSPSASSRSVSAAAANAQRKRQRRQQSATFKSLVPRFAPLVAHGSGLTAPVIR